MPARGSVRTVIQDMLKHLCSADQLRRRADARGNAESVLGGSGTVSDQAVGFVARRVVQSVSGGSLRRAGRFATGALACPRALARKVEGYAGTEEPGHRYCNEHWTISRIDHAQFLGTAVPVPTGGARARRRSRAPVAKRLLLSRLLEVPIRRLVLRSESSGSSPSGCARRYAPRRTHPDRRRAPRGSSRTARSSR